MSKKQKLLSIIGGAILIALVAAALLLWNGFSAKPQEGSKQITFELILKDESSKEYTIKTDAEFLAEALAEEELITYDESGLYTTINGITCDYNKDQSWWSITKDGEMTLVGMNEQPIADGEHYEATYTIS